MAIQKAREGNTASVEILITEGEFIVFGQLRDSVCLLVAVSGDMFGLAGNVLPSTIASMVEETQAIAGSV
ncbi:hypothetical protein ACFWP5_48920 [Streptomyces sp. NPDC058469]|uniref:hypothetical protein n=1 Tax=Streptomyces sp. NPDC058469 TaxID=3346514 RepID=UPI003649A817